MSRLILHNTTRLSDERLLASCRDGLAGWAVGTVTLRIRYSRRTDFSGTCFYSDRRIFVNVGRHVKYPYRMATSLARTKNTGARWYKPIYALDMADGCQLAVFVFMHELYHLLVKRAGRNPRQKESMCDRFAARFFVDRFRAVVCGPGGVPVPRAEWDFQDLDGFVAAARDRRVNRSLSVPPADPAERHGQEQLLLFAP